MARKKKTDSKSIVAKTAEEQAIEQPPVETPDDMDTVTENGMIRAKGQVGGMFVPTLPHTPTPTPAPVYTNDLTEINRLKNEIAQLEQRIAQAATAEPATTTDQPDQPPAQTPTAPRGTPMFGIDIKASTDPNPAQPPSKTQHLTAQTPTQPPVVPNKDLPAHGYIAVSRKGEGFAALVIDGLVRADLDYIDFMSKYIHNKYPGALPEPHPALIVKFAINHLLRDIRQEIAQNVTCGKCKQVFDIRAFTCPHCGAPNRCTQCGLLIGNGNIYI